MCCQRESFLSKMNLRYFQVFFGYKIGSSSRLRSKGERLKFFVDLEKCKTSDFPCSIVSLN